MAFRQRSTFVQRGASWLNCLILYYCLTRNEVRRLYRYKVVYLICRHLAISACVAFPMWNSQKEVPCCQPEQITRVEASAHVSMVTVYILVFVSNKSFLHLSVSMATAEHVAVPHVLAARFALRAGHCPQGVSARGQFPNLVVSLKMSLISTNTCSIHCMLWCCSHLHYSFEFRNSWLQLSAVLS
jgi:hypothetical protein